jgi:hypothetical protein
VLKEGGSKQKPATSLVALLREKKAQTPARTAVSAPNRRMYQPHGHSQAQPLSERKSATTSKQKERRAAAAGTPRDAAKRSKRVRKGDQR